MTAPTTDAVLAALEGVIDPDLGQNIVALGFITRCEVTPEGAVSVVINLTTPACPVKDEMREQARGLIAALDGVTSVDVEMTAEVRRPDGPAREAAKDVKQIVAVSSGKGGVGKSTTAVNLACALAKTGARVGLLDCDVHGPDVPMMMGLNGSPEQREIEGKQTLIPKVGPGGVKTMSIGYLIPDDQPVIWRGPMVHSFIRQMLTDVLWGELDYLILDMPPGTGDVPLTMSQLLSVTGAVIVCTPQKVAQDDAVRAVRMFQQLGIDILGVVENMSEFIGDDGKHYDIFGKGGAERMAQRMGLPFLGDVPINTSLRANSDKGDPSANFKAKTAGGDALPTALEKLAQNLESQVALAELRQGKTKPKLTIS